MKTHFAYCEEGNESDPETYWSATLCGIEDFLHECSLTYRPEYVTCKKCLKQIELGNHIIDWGEIDYPSLT